MIAAMPEPVIAAQLLRHVANCLELTGRSGADLLDELGLAREVLDGTDRAIPLAKFLTFFERAADLARNPAFGLHAGRLVSSDSIGPLSFLFLSAPDLDTAFASFTRYLDTMQQASRNRFAVGGGRAMFEYRVIDPAMPQRRQDAEYSISAMFSLARQYTAGAIDLIEVRFEHDRLAPYAAYRDYFGCDVFFAQDTNLLVFAAQHLAHRGKVLSPTLHPIMEDHLRRRADAGTHGGIVDQVRAALADAPLDKPPSIVQVAGKMGVSVPTLNRRLRTQGTSWRALLEEYRLGAADHMLRHSLRSIGDIALAVGYAESASFSRAFTRHFGTNPTDCRR